MENLNAEQIKKALKCCLGDRMMCNKCPIQDECESNPFDAILAKYAFSLIEELTEENERLRADNKMVSKRTVRKFVKMLKSHDCRCDSCINEIKKEIENEN